LQACGERASFARFLEYAVSVWVLCVGAEQPFQPIAVDVEDETSSNPRFGFVLEAVGVFCDALLGGQSELFLVDDIASGNVRCRAVFVLNGVDCELRVAFHQHEYGGAQLLQRGVQPISVVHVREAELFGRI